MQKKALVLVLVLSMLFLVGCNNDTPSSSAASSTPESSTAAPESTTVTIWHYFSGAQQGILDEIVAEFNETVGEEEGIVVVAENQGVTADLEKKVQTASEGGIQNLPDIVHGYPDIMATLHAKGQIADLGSYLTEEEIAGYYESFLEEGSQFGDGTLRLMPIAKSTELLFVNRTLWDNVKETIGCTDEDLGTWDGIAKAGKAYFDEYKIGFYAIDSYANFVYLNGYQQGVEYVGIDEDGNGIVNPDRDALERTFNFIKGGLDDGWLVIKDQSRSYPSDWMSAGAIVCYAGSNSGTTFVAPRSNDGENTEEDELDFMPYPVWSDVVNKAVIQQGAGMSIVAKGEEVEKAATVFLKFLTNEANTARFSMSSAYLPVQKNAANDPVFNAFLQGLNEDGEPLDLRSSKISGAIGMAIEMFETYDMYYTPAFEGSNLIRRAVDSEVAKIFSGVHTDFDSYYDTLSSAMLAAIEGR